MALIRSYHSSDVLVLLEIFDNLRFVGRFDTSEASGTLTGDELFIWGKVIEFTTSVGFSVSFFISFKDSNFASLKKPGSFPLPFLGDN